MSRVYLVLLISIYCRLLINLPNEIINLFDISVFLKNIIHLL